jgi:hypothetical protein
MVGLFPVLEFMQDGAAGLLHALILVGRFLLAWTMISVAAAAVWSLIAWRLKARRTARSPAVAGRPVGA